MNFWKKTQSWWDAARLGWNKAETWADNTIGLVPTAVLHVSSIVITIGVIVMLISRRLPEEGALSPPNVIFLGFVVIFGLMGMSSSVKTRVWAALGLVAGLIVWGLSVFFARP